jgi:hypothetical protein
MVLDRGIVKGLRLYKEKIIRQRGKQCVSDEVRRSGIAGYLFGTLGKGRI